MFPDTAIELYRDYFLLSIVILFINNGYFIINVVIQFLKISYCYYFIIIPSLSIFQYPSYFNSYLNINFLYLEVLVEHHILHFLIFPFFIIATQNLIFPNPKIVFPILTFIL